MQDRIDPKVMVEALRRDASRAACEFVGAAIGRAMVEMLVDAGLTEDQAREQVRVAVENEMRRRADTK